MDQHKRVAEYAYRFWRRADMTEWPTVRQAARALGIRQNVFEETSDLFTLTAFHAKYQKLGDNFVEAELPQVEIAWCGYWLRYSRGCYCGQHR